MIDQPKPTGEWTVGFVMELLGFNSTDGCIRIADAHNAALAAEREKHRKEMEAVTMNTSDIETVQQLREQLAAELERYKQLEIHADFADEQLRQLREEMDSIQQLAKVGKQL